MKTCEIFFRDDSIYIFPQSKTKTGIRIACEPFSKLDQHITATSLGEHTLRALNSSYECVDLPANLKSVTAAVLNFTGFKSWRTFAKEASGVYLEFNGMDVKITPLIACGDGSFSYSGEQAVKCSPESEILGRNLLILLPDRL